MFKFKDLFLNKKVVWDLVVSWVRCLQEVRDEMIHFLWKITFLDLSSSMKHSSV